MAAAEKSETPPQGMKSHQIFMTTTSAFLAVLIGILARLFAAVVAAAAGMAAVGQQVRDMLWTQQWPIDVSSFLCAANQGQFTQPASMQRGQVKAHENRKCPQSHIRLCSSGCKSQGNTVPIGCKGSPTFFQS